MTNLLLTIDFYRERQEEMQATIKAYTDTNHDPATLLEMFKQLAFSDEQKLPRALYENFVEEKAHFKARGKINLARRRYDAKQRLIKETTFLSGPAVEALKAENNQRLEERLAAKAKPLTVPKKNELFPPPPDTPRDAIQVWENYYGVKYDWSQWTGPQTEAEAQPPVAQPLVEDWSLKASQSELQATTTGHEEADVFVLKDEVDFPPDEVDGQEDAALAEAQAAFLANNKKYQSKE